MRSVNVVLFDTEKLHLDRGYSGDPVRQTCLRYGINDIMHTPKRPPKISCGQPKTAPLGMRWNLADQHHPT